METRRLGKSDLVFAPLALGANVFGWTIDEPTSFKILDHFAGAGFTFVDTANVYSRWKAGHVGGESETIIGKWMAARGNRSKMLIATKVGMEMGPDQKGLAKRYILQSVEDSLRRLQTDYIDLYQSHTDDLETPVEETLSAYAQLVEQGKVRYIGASNYKADRLAESLTVSSKKKFPRYVSLQPHYNLYEREDFEKNLQGICSSEGLGVIPYFGLARGFLSGKYRSEADLGKSARGAGISRYLNERGFRILAALDQVSQELDTTQASIALAWLTAQPTITAPISSATSIEQLDQLIDASQLRLKESQFEILDQASSYAQSA